MTTDPVASNLQPARGAWRAALVCALAGIAVFQFWGNATRGYIDTRSVFWWWGYQWFNPASESEHGLMVLAIAAWLLWRNLGGNSKLQIPSSKEQETSDGEQRPRSEDSEDGDGVGALRNLEARPPGRVRGDEGVAAPCAAMLGGLVLHLLGYAVQQTRISIVALLVFAWGVCALAGGRRLGRAAVFPLAFMVFAIPVDVLDTLGFYLRLGVTDVAYAAARAVGLDIVRNGTQLFSGHGGYQYDVAAACSGVRSLMALAALSLLVGYLSLRTWRARLLVLGLCAPYAFAGNVVRMIAIVFSAEWFGQRAGNIVHEWFGFLVFAIVLVLQLATVRLLKKWRAEAEQAAAANSGRRRARSEHGENASGRILVPGTWNLGFGTWNLGFGTWDLKPGTWDRLRWPIAAAVVLASVLVAFAAGRLDALQASPDAGVFLAAGGRDPAELPSFLAGGWMGRDVPVSAAEHAVLPPDTGYSRKNYIWLSDSARQVFVSIVLSGRDRTSIHRPELCLLGQGWTIDGRFGHAFAYPGSAVGTIPATVLRVRRQMLAPRGGRTAVPTLLAYWFVGQDRVVAGHWERMWWSAIDRLCRFRSSRWAYVVVQTTALDGETAALARLQTVLNQTLPAFEKPPPG